MPEEITETTNAVLAEKIKGLTDVTDIRLKNVEEYLKRIEANNSSYATKSELSEVKKDFTDTIQRIEQNFVKHNADDMTNFGRLSDGQDKLNLTIQRWIGALAIIAITLPIIVPLILHFTFHIG